MKREWVKRDRSGSLTAYAVAMTRRLSDGRTSLIVEITERGSDPERTRVVFPSEADALDAVDDVGRSLGEAGYM